MIWCTLVMRSKDERTRNAALPRYTCHNKDDRTRNAALLRYTCGHDGRYFGLFNLIVMDHHIVINSKFFIVVYH